MDLSRPRQIQQLQLFVQISSFAFDQKANVADRMIFNPEFANQVQPFAKAGCLREICEHDSVGRLYSADVSQYSFFYL
jgi:hypothetical protein